MNRAEEVRRAVRPHLGDDFDLNSMLSFVELDLTRDEGWLEAVKTVDIVMHTASPFPIDLPKHEDDLIRPAVDGTIRALKAARDAGVKRVIVTSSTASVVYRDAPTQGNWYSEEDWTDTNHASCAAYAKSKTLAEKAAWTYIENEAPDISLTTINPGLVLGPPLDGAFGTSIQVIVRLMGAKDPALPRLGFSTVDVRDIAAMHVRTIDRPSTFGLRILGVSAFTWFEQIASTLKAEFPQRRIATRVAPDWIIKILGLFDKQIRSIVPNLSQRSDVSNDRARKLLDMDFIDPQQTVVDTAHYLVQNKLV